MHYCTRITSIEVSEGTGCFKMIGIKEEMDAHAYMYVCDRKHATLCGPNAMH